MREAYEEAGVEGKVTGNCIGIYSHTKSLRKNEDLPFVVAIYPMKVARMLLDYPEKSQRKRKWFSLKKAAAVVDHPELRQIIKDFDPRAIG